MVKVLKMPTKTKKTKKNIIWLIVAASLSYILLLAPYNTLVRIMEPSVDPYYLVAVKIAIVGIVCLPITLRSLKKLFNKRMYKYTLGSAFFSAIAIITAPLAVYASQASYVSVIALSFPVMFVLLSTWLLKEKLTHRTVAGIALALAGASIIVLVPFAINHSGGEFYLLGTILAIANGVSAALATILVKKTHAMKIPVMATLGVNSWFALAVSVGLFMLLGDPSKTPTDIGFIIFILYASIGVTLLGKVVNLKMFELTNSAFVSVIMYVQTFAAIVTPVLILGESLSLPMVIGGVCILIAVYIIESHKTHHFHKHTWHHH